MNKTISAKYSSPTLREFKEVHPGNDLQGVQHVYRFQNGYGASVVNHEYSYGLELAVIRFMSPSINDWDLCYDTKITSDVLPRIDESEMLAYLRQIDELPADAQALPGAEFIHNEDTAPL